MANCTVSGTFTNPQGSAISGATVRFNLQKPVLDLSGNLLMPKEITTTTAADGSWSLSIVQGVAGNLTLAVNTSSNSPSVNYNFSLLIPSTTTATFASCWVDSATFAGGTTTTPLTFSAIAGQLTVAQLPTLPSADIWVGDALGVAAPLSLSGDASLSNAGVLTVNTVGGSTAALIHSGELLANTATNLNTASAVVARDVSGNFSAGTITASLSGHSSLDLQASNNLSDVGAQQTALNNLVGNVVTSGAVLRGSGSNVSMSPLQVGDVPTLNQNTTGSAASFTGSLVGDVTGTQGATVVSAVGTSTASNLHLAEVAANAATNLNTVSTIVKRDGSGNFSAGVITANLTGNVTGNVTGTVTGHSTLDLQVANNLSDVASTTAAFATIAPAPSTSGNVLTSNGSAWVSSASTSGPTVLSAVGYITAFYSFS